MLDELGILFPLWMQTVRVRFDPEDKDNVAYMTADKEYRRCTIRICPAFLELSDWQQTETLVHEIMHNFNAPVGDAAMDQLNTLYHDREDDEDINRVLAYKVASASIARAVEGVNQDLTYMIMRLLERQKTKQDPG